jgi:hypothetical protein
MGILKRSLENVFENLGVESTPLKCFQKWLWTMEMIMEDKGSWWFSNDIGDH